LLKFCVKILFFEHCFSPLNKFMRKTKEPDPVPYLCLMDPDPGGQKTCGSCEIRIRIPNTGKPENRHPSPQKMTFLPHLNSVLVCGNGVSSGFPARHVRSGNCVILNRKVENYLSSLLVYEPVNFANICDNKSFTMTQ